MGGGRDERDDAREVVVGVVGQGVESLFGEGEDRLLQTVVEFAADGLVLGGEGGFESTVGNGGPAVETIDLGTNAGVSRVVGVAVRSAGLTLLRATMKGVLPSRSSRRDSIV